MCGGTWNLHTPAVAAYTTCIPTNKTGVAYMTASAGGFTSNQVAVYSHPPLTSLSVKGPTDRTRASPYVFPKGKPRNWMPPRITHRQPRGNKQLTVQPGYSAPPAASTVPDCNT